MSELLKQFKQRIKFVKARDILSVFPMTLGYFCSLPFKCLHRNIWLICEREKEARDNGYWFFKYMRECHPDIEAVYAIDRKSNDYNKVAELGKIIQFGSLTHWIYYFAAKKNISSQKEGKPNAALCYFIEVYLGARKNRVYLKHGIIKDAQRWIYYDVSKLNLICCAAPREYEYIRDTFGYPYSSVVLTGLCRFDNLLTEHKVKRQILIMPTMREWLRIISSDTLIYEKTNVFTESEYFLTWKHLLESSDLSQLLNSNDLNLIFYPHPAMQKYIDCFDIPTDRIKIASANEYDMQQLLMESAVLVTDYSSIYFDFAYMLKPLVYYQFDYEKYRRGQYQQGYFSYTDDGFGPVVNCEVDLLKELSTIIENKMMMSNKYRNRAENFYAFHDTKNCERTFKEIIRMGGEKNERKL